MIDAEIIGNVDASTTIETVKKKKKRLDKNILHILP